MVEEEIDLRAFIEVPLRYWKWIVGLMAVAVVFAFIMSSLQPPTYEASAVVLVTEPRYQLQFDPRFGTEGRIPAGNAFATLATTDGILQGVVEAYIPGPQAAIEDWNLVTLSRMVEVSSSGDSGLVKLRARSRSPEAAAAIANAWADVLVQQGQAIYGESERDVTFLEDQLRQAEQALNNADSVLIEFQAGNQARLIDAALKSELQAQTDYLASQRAITYLIQDIQGLRAQLAEQSNSQSASLADDLTVLLLQIRAFNAQASADGTAPIQLQIDGSGSLSDKSAYDQVALLDDLVETLRDKRSDIDERLAEQEPQILALQKQGQEVQAKEDRLVQARDLARETYLTLSRKLEEARITAQEESGGLQVGSYAAIPQRAVGPRRLFNTAVAGMLALMVGVVAAFAIDFWRKDGKQRHTDEE